MRKEIKVLRNYVKNIIRYVGLDNLDVDITIDSDLDMFRAGYSVGFRPKKFTYALNLGTNSIFNEEHTIVKNILELEEYFSHPLFKNIDSNVLLWTFFVLHEIGHLEYFSKYYRSKNKYFRLDDKTKTEKSMLMSAFNFPTEQSTFLEVYHLQAIELYANSFAFRQFPFIISSCLTEEVLYVSHIFTE